MKMTERELQICAVAILTYETIRQNPQEIPGFACAINNSVLENTLAVCAGVNADLAIEAIGRIVKREQTPGEDTEE